MIDDEFILRSNIPSILGDFHSLLRNALLNKGTKYDYAEGFVLGEKKGFGEGVESSIKSFVTSGKSRIFITDDKILPYRNNDDLLANEEIKPLIRDFTNDLQKNKPDIFKKIENDLAGIKQEYEEKKQNEWNKPTQAELDFDEYLHSFKTFDKTKPLEEQLNNMINDMESKLINETKIKTLNKSIKSMTKKNELGKEYDGPIDENYLKKIDSRLSELKKLYKINKEFYGPKVKETQDLKTELNNFFNFKNIPLSYKEEIKKEKDRIEREKNSYEETIEDFMRELKEEKQKYYNRPDYLWQKDFKEDKHKDIAVYNTPKFSIINIDQIQKLFPDEKEIDEKGNQKNKIKTAQAKLEQINKTPLTQTQMKSIKNYTKENKNIKGSTNIMDYIKVPKQNIDYTLEDLISKKYPNMDQVEKNALDLYIKDIRSKY